MEFSVEGKYHIFKGREKYPNTYCGLEYYRDLEADIIPHHGRNDSVGKDWLLEYQSIICKKCFKAHMKVVAKREIKDE